MKSLRKWYAGFKWRDRILTLVFVQIILLTISFQLGYDLILTALTGIGILTALHFFFEKSKFPVPAIIMLLQTAALSVTFKVYAIFSQPMFGNTAYLFAAFILTVATILVFILAYKYSVGRLWITLLLAYVGLDLLGPILMQTFTTTNPFVGISAGFLILGIRSILWRDLFRNRKAEIPDGIKTQKNTDSLKTLIESIEGVRVSELSQDALDFKIDTPVNTYYVNAVTLRQRIVITNEDVASGIYNLKSTLFETARKTVQMNKSVKRKMRKNSIPCIVNTTDKSNSSVAINVSITGKTRDNGKDVIILSPSSLVNLIKKDMAKS